MSNDRKVNRFSLGPRARRVIRFVARFVNPIVLLVAGRRWMPVVGIIHHRGRRSGRDYATPIGRTCELVDPEVVDYGTARPAFPRYELLQFRLIGINEYLRLRVATSPLAGEVGGRPGGGIQLANAKETHMETTLAVKPLSRNLNLALVLLALAQLMVVLDSAIVNVALPSIQHALHFNPTDLEWVINAYTITFGGLLLLGGRAGDLFGRRRMFIIGALVFTAGSLAGGFANSPTFLIIARAAQGIGGAILAPTALSILAQTFTEGKERNRAFGVYSAVSAGGGAIGLLIGGIITNYFSGRWIMFINVPIGLLIAFAAPRLLARSEGRPGRLDLPGALTVTGGSTLLVYSLSHAAIHGWSNNVTVATLAISLLLLVTFVALESRGSHPLMPLLIFANRNRSGAYALSLAVGASLSGMLFLLTLFLQNVLRFSPLQAGFAFLPTALSIAVGAGLTSRLIGRVGPRVPMTTGALLTAIGLFWLSAVTPQSNYAFDVVGPLVVLAVGLGMAFVSTSVVAISGIKPSESGLASALLNVGRQLGGSLGIAIMGTIAATVTRNQLAAGPLTHAALNSALTAGFTSAFQVAGLLAIAGFVAALIAVRHRQVPAEEIVEDDMAA